MPKHSQSDEPQKANIRVSIKITFPLTPIRNNDEFSEERRSESSLLVNTLKELGATDYKIRYCVVINGEREFRSERRAYYLTPGVPEWTQFGQFIVQAITNISMSIAENKLTLDIVADFANIFQLTIPITNVILHLLHRAKTTRESKKIPTVNISYKGLSINVTDESLKKAEGSAITLLKQSLEVLQEYPKLVPDKKLSINGSYTSPRQRKRKKGKKGKR